MKYETAGDPVSGLRWTRKTTEKIADELLALNIRVSRKTVAKLLKQNNFSLRTNKKKISNGSPPERDAQFATIAQLRERFGRRGNPILSVDTKKRELVGRFKNPGRVWARQSDAVNDHDFRSMAKGVAIPYGMGCVPRSVEKERRPPLRHQSIRSGGNLRVFENLAQTLVAVDAS